MNSKPVDRYWLRTKPGSCVDGDRLMLIIGGINCVMDFLIIALVCPKTLSPNHYLSPSSFPSSSRNARSLKLPPLTPLISPAPPPPLASPHHNVPKSRPHLNFQHGRLRAHHQHHPARRPRPPLQRRRDLEFHRHCHLVLGGTQHGRHQRLLALAETFSVVAV